MKKIFICILLLLLAGCQKNEITLETAVDIALNYSDMDAAKTTIVKSLKEDDGFYVLLENNERKAELRLDENGEVTMYNDLPFTDISMPPNSNSDAVTTNDPVYDGSLADEFLEALNLTLEYFEVDRSAVSEVQVDQEDNQDGVYDVDFVSEDTEFEAKVNILNGEFYDARKERNDDYFIAFNGTLSWNDAFAAALKANELSEDEVYDVSIDEEYLRQTAVMEIDYRAHNKEYKVVIDALSGEVIKNEIDH